MIWAEKHYVSWLSAPQGILRCLHLFWRQELNRLLEEKPVPEGQYGAWRAELKEQEAKFPLAFPQRDDVIVPQWAIKVLEQPCAHCCVTRIGQAIPG